MKVVVYTSIMGSNPELNNPIDTPGDFNKIPGWDYVLITNYTNGKQIFKKSGWSKGEIRIMEPPKDEMPNMDRRGWSIYASRWFKWHPDRIFSDYDIAIWVDGWQIPDYNKRDEWYKLVDNMLNNKENKHCILHDLHKRNKCIYDEHTEIVFCEKDTYVNILKVSKYVKVMGCPINLGLYWTGCSIYKIGSERIQNVFKNLWEDMLMYTYRDQALLTFEIWRNNAFDVWGTARINDMVVAVGTDNKHNGYL